MQNRCISNDISAILINLLSLPMDWALTNTSFLLMMISSKPDLVAKKTDSSNESKSSGDAPVLVPVLGKFFSLHPNFHSDTFLGDTAFDSAELYGILMNNFLFSKAPIPCNPRN